MSAEPGDRGQAQGFLERIMTRALLTYNVYIYMYMYMCVLMEMQQDHKYI